MTRPSEAITAIVGTIVAAIVGILAGVGINVPEGVYAGAIVIIAWIAAAVTYIVSKRQSRGQLNSGPTGKVTSRR